MKRNSIYIKCLLLTTLSLSSCHKDLLEPIPESVLTTVNFYGSAKDIDQAVIGAYSGFQARKPTDYLLLEIPSDNLYASANTSVSGANALDILALTTDNDLVANFWSANYSVIFRANAVLVNIDKPLDYKATQKDQFIGEAKFLRALMYFDLVRLYGGVPKVTTLLSAEAARQVPRASEEEIYGLIVDDLLDAINKLPQTFNVRGRASKGAAIALLGKVYVYQKNWIEAEKQLAKLFTAPYTYGLVTNFADLWKLTNENNSESIFALTYIEGSNAHTLSTAFIPNGGAPGIVDRGAEVALPSWSLHKKYITGDTRKAATITEMWRAPAKPNDPLTWYPFVAKYAVPHVYGSSGLDLPVLRFADVVLLYAEVLYERNKPAEALIELNKVRQRAFGNASQNYLLSGITNSTDFIDKLFLERQLELAYENERWFDLVRSGKYLNFTSEERPYNPATSTALSVAVATRIDLKYFPIPLKEIEKAAPGVLTQNKGYN
ncbi:Starch-binding associating with outer membrane [Pedobacter nyackensis]|uniref:Starch-binding associating with outer membrane n=2 Tax=Pedobacter nyackensis TaxID=475255 RepID=A0A1W2F8K7_9SPHI|nr:Starch-binding associating with outer membrane [Pedobacter nyackensis]